MAQEKIYDVLIIGGGPAGLSMAVGLARQNHTALIFDSEKYRNEKAQHMHNVPGFDHASPSEFRAKIRDDLRRRYQSIEYKPGTTITEARKLDSGTFEVTDSSGVRYLGKKLGLGTGVSDEFEHEVPGYADCWSRGVFHCLFCHGFEEKGAESAGLLVGALVLPPGAVLQIARMAKRLSERTTIYTQGNAELSDSLKALIRSSKIDVDTRPIASLALVGAGPQVEVTFKDGTNKVEGFITSHPKVRQQASHLVEQLGLETTPSGDIQVKPPFNETSLPGCFAAGDAITPMRAVVQAMQTGGFAAAGAVGQLQGELEQQDEL